jgi:hypothetical protein
LLRAVATTVPRVMFIPSRIGRFALAVPVFARNLERVGIRQILQFEMITNAFHAPVSQRI